MVDDVVAAAAAAVAAGSVVVAVAAGMSFEWRVGQSSGKYSVAAAVGVAAVAHRMVSAVHGRMVDMADSAVVSPAAAGMESSGARTAGVAHFEVVHSMPSFSSSPHAAPAAPDSI